jgi:hypothetical protein
LLNPDGSINYTALNKYRIDSYNGLFKIFGIKETLKDFDSEDLLADIRKILMSVEDKTELEKLIGNLLNNQLLKLGKPALGNLYIRFAIKTTESN